MSDERAREHAERIVEAARRGDRETFDREWAIAGETTRRFVEGEARVAVIERMQRREEVRR